MEWYEEFKIGQEVRVVKKVECWKYCGGSTDWNSQFMDGTLGKVYKIIEIEETAGYKLHTQIPTPYDRYLYDYYYPVESLTCVNVKGQQLLFSFMEKN